MKKQPEINKISRNRLKCVCVCAWFRSHPYWRIELLASNQSSSCWRHYCDQLHCTPANHGHLKSMTSTSWKPWRWHATDICCGSAGKSTEPMNPRWTRLAQRICCHCQERKLQYFGPELLTRDWWLESLDSTAVARELTGHSTRPWLARVMLSCH